MFDDTHRQGHRVRLFRPRRAGVGAALRSVVATEREPLPAEFQTLLARIDQLDEQVMQPRRSLSLRFRRS
jgi:hypothetical protein